MTREQIIKVLDRKQLRLFALPRRTLRSSPSVEGATHHAPPRFCVSQIVFRQMNYNIKNKERAYVS